MFNNLIHEYIYMYIYMYIYIYIIIYKTIIMANRESNHYTRFSEYDMLIILHSFFNLRHHVRFGLLIRSHPFVKLRFHDILMTRGYLDMKRGLPLRGWELKGVTKPFY